MDGDPKNLRGGLLPSRCGRTMVLPILSPRKSEVSSEWHHREHGILTKKYYYSDIVSLVEERFMLIYRYNASMIKKLIMNACGA